MVKIGIIGGTGMDDPHLWENRVEKDVDTPYGKPSDKLIVGRIKNIECVLLSRHGRKHNINPTNVNYQANMYAFWKEGCSHVIVTTACGSLKDEMAPGHLVFLDQFIDRTNKRPLTMFDGGENSLKGVCHIPMGMPFCNNLREVLINCAKELQLPFHSTGTTVTIEGPRFSTKAESFLFKSWNCDIVNMTTVPEVTLAKELGMSYASIALVTDYDCWKENEEVSVESVMKQMKENADRASKLILHAIPVIASKDWTKIIKDNQDLVESSTM
ncbi:DgyrCDS1364 [Dimorphilus gyrociliatus]|uniref:S-methyl-5'-thioadenosine phosphorylase n=1 Tax=Dimorphilus gyrociliatus TaxID=2664684 RepID=A0A7I8V8K5_9ANNE|nr:DgyrCDS1364 [Dimorphilus gyrociliatus]